MRELRWSDIPSLWPALPADATCYCVGSGPSLDAVNLNRLSGKAVLCCNAAAVYVFRSACRSTAWWVCNNQNAIEQSAALVPQPWRVICLERVREQIDKHSDKVDTVVYYTKFQHFPRHTTAESMLRIAQVAGFRRAVLIGVDCDAATSEVYARDCRHVNCIYEEPRKRVEYMQRFVEALEDFAVAALPDMVVSVTSPVFPRRMIPYVPFEEAAAW